MMAYHDDVLIWIQLLMGAARNVSHRNQLRISDLGQFELPGLANVE